jgi:hypothetical protein
LPRRRLVLRNGDEVLREVERLSAGCTPTGAWDLPRTVWHLVEAMERSLHGTPRPLKGLRRLAGPLLLRLVLLTRRFPEGRPLARGLTPPEAAPLDRARLERAVRAVEKGSWFVPHPVFGRMTPAQWREVHWIHAAHHLGFLLPDG